MNKFCTFQTAVDSAVNMKDLSVIVDLLNLLNQKS